MVKYWFIYQLSQIGNIGAHEIKKIVQQPKDGFETMEDAELHLETLLNSKKWPFNGWYSFSILPIYKTKQ